MTVLQVLLVALYYGFFSSQPFILLMGVSTFGSIAGLIIGLIMGEPGTGVMIGAMIQVTYLGTVGYGGTRPFDQFLATSIIVPVAVATDMPATLALALAMFFSALGGVVLDNPWKKINTNVWGPRIDKAVETLNYGEIARCSGLYPMLTRMLLSCPFVIVCIYAATFGVNWFLGSAPQWLITGLSNTGLLLPAMGFALFITTYGRNAQIPFFLAGFLVMVFADLPILGIAAFGGFLAYLSVAWTDNDLLKKKGV